MSYIEELRQRVESAERRFGLIDEQQRRYSERLITLMNALESAQEERQAEAASHQARIVELERENGELRGMLHALLLGVEAGSRDTLAGTLRDLDARMSGLVPPAVAARNETPGGAVLMDAELPAEALATDDEPAADDMALPDDITASQDADAVAAAEQAVAELLNTDAEGGAIEERAIEDIAGDEIVMDEFTSEAVIDDPGSPVADMIERLAIEAQDLAEPAAELVFDEAAVEDTAEPILAPEPRRKKA